MKWESKSGDYIKSWSKSSMKDSIFKLATYVFEILLELGWSKTNSLEIYLMKFRSNSKYSIELNFTCECNIL